MGDAVPPAVTLVTSKDDDPTVLTHAVRAVVDRLVGDEDRSLTLEELGEEDLTVGAVVDSCQTAPLLTSRRVIVVRDVGRWASEELEPLIAYVGDPLATTALVLVGGGGKLSQRLVNAAKKHGEVLDVSVPTGKARGAWLADQLHAGPVRFDVPAANRLGDHLGEDVGRLPGVVEALAARYGAGARIGVEELEPYLGEAGGLAPWDLTDALDRGDTAAALSALRRMTGAGERHPLAVLGTLHRHYGAMLRLEGSGATSESEAAALVGMAPFPAGKALRVARRLGYEGVARAITLLGDADLDLRGLKDWPDQLVLEVLVARLSRLGPRPPARAGGRGHSNAGR
jgi:DNA polymerase-3 subunit delta